MSLRMAFTTLRASLWRLNVEARLDARIFVNNKGRLKLIGEWLKAIMEGLSAQLAGGGALNDFVGHGVCGAIRTVEGALKVRVLPRSMTAAFPGLAVGKVRVLPIGWAQLRRAEGGRFAFYRLCRPS